MDLITLPAFTFAFITSTIALLHFYWAAGGTAGITAAIPTHKGQPVFKPGPLATFSVGAALLMAAVISLQYVGVLNLPLPSRLISLGMWTLGFVFLLRAIGDFSNFGFFKHSVDTQFARLDTRFYSPLCLLLASLIFGSIVTSTSLFN